MLREVPGRREGPCEGGDCGLADEAPVVAGLQLLDVLRAEHVQARLIAHGCNLPFGEDEGVVEALELAAGDVDDRAVEPAAVLAREADAGGDALELLHVVVEGALDGGGEPPPYWSRLTRWPSGPSSHTRCLT